MPYEFYKVLHLIGIFMTLSGLVGVMTLKWAGGPIPSKPRRTFFLVHGIGLLIVFVAGFGLAARTGLIGGFPLWLWTKLGIWLALGGIIAFAKRKGDMGIPLLTSIIALAGIAGWLAIYKPF